MDPRRRDLLRASLAAGIAASGGLLASRVSLAAPGAGEQRFVLVLLRGALDGLAAVPPVGDPDYARLRGELNLSDAASLPKLEGPFALHPSLQFLAAEWNARRLAVAHAVATPYRDRSHFDAQDVLESGHARPHAVQSGWLNRALAGMPSVRGAGRNAGVALGANIPLVMRGPTEVASWSPGRLPDLEDDTLQRLADLYADDPLLSRRLADALAADAIAEAGSRDDAMRGGASATASSDGGVGAQVQKTARATAEFLVRPDGPRVAVFETTGWDTHANQGSEAGVLALRLRALDAGLRSLREALGPAWDRTAVLVATEFGRTAAVNGTRGTDHGTGAAAFLLGGAVRGGRMVGAWPGLSAAALYQGRDLQPTTDLRSVMKTVLRDHMQVPQRLLEESVFPDSAAAGYLPGLI
ncbi:MAG: DUF1501 domain-containing protein [Proteobacteria bacterium]|nr:DUF1501 domain-containing protein [Pseudomonadota bacterium]